MAVPATSNGGQPGKSKAEVNRKKQSYTQTFTSSLDYPKKALEHVPAPSETSTTNVPTVAMSQRAQRKAKSNAISKMDTTRELEATIPLSISSNSSSTIEKATAPKTTLLPSMSSNLSSASNGTSDLPSEPKPGNNPILKKAHVARAPALDRKSVRWSGPRIPKPQTGTRHFGLKECPTFYPTAEEFQDPMEYLRKIGDEGQGKEFGMCKVVPPEGWQMPFVLNTEIFRFQTRLQRLNSLEASSRAKINFLDQLYMFHKQQGNPNVTIPVLDHRPVDIWALRKAVNKAGGLAAVNLNKGWGDIAKSLGYSYAQTPHVKSAYLKIVQPFDDFYSYVKTSPLSQLNHSVNNNASPLTPLPSDFPPPPSTSSKSHLEKADVSATPSRIVGNTEKLGSPTRPSQLETKRSTRRTSESAEPSRLRIITRKGKTSTTPDDDLVNAKDLEAVENAMQQQLDESSATADEAQEIVQKRKRKLDASSVPATPPPKRANVRQGRMGFVGGGGAGPNEVFVTGDACEVCRSGRDGTKLLLCDECDRGFHIYCLDPPLSKVPMNEEWYCPACLLGTGNDYGFDIGQEHSIQSFQERADAFKHDYFKLHRPTGPLLVDEETCENFGDIKVGEAEVEAEFWRLVENEYETVEVEYGADVHSITHGSAAPTPETHPTNPWSANPWNLNNLPILPKSLLRYIRSDISGMTVPWAYIGMLFSAFCWHNEDHYTYSVNYMYWGSTKTWYGIPGAHAEKFEETIMQEAPELFEQQPGLLYQLVTMMNPGRLQDMGVDVFACNQRPNEFVITFPKAYHCGFNHGLNFNEAVNFALPDWLHFGKESVTRYQLHCKPPVFSHEELLMTISHFSQSIDTAIWLDAALTETVDTEIRKRDILREAAIHLGEIIDNADKSEEQYTCCVCKAFCYLSQVTCKCTSNVTCLDHAANVCKCPISTRILRKRASEEHLQLLQKTVHDRAMIPSNWRQRFEAMLAESPRPTVKALKSALMEAEKITYPMPELSSLQPFVAEVNTWLARASKLLNRKKTIKKRGRRGNEEIEEMDEDEEEKGSARTIQDFIKSADALGFDAPETLQMRQLASSVSEFESRARATLETPEEDLQLHDVEGILLIGESLPVDVPEVGRLRTLVNRLKWMAEMNELDEAFLELKDVIDYIDRAGSCEVPSEHEFVRNLLMKLENGKDWLAKAERLVGRNETFQPQISDEPSIRMEELDELLRQDIDRPVVGEVMGKLGQIKGRIQSAQATLRSITSLAGHPKRGTIMQVQKAFSSAKAKAGAVDLTYMEEWQECVAVLEQYQEWLDELKEAFGFPRDTSNAEVQDALYRDFEAVVSLLDPDDDVYTQPEVEMTMSGKTIYHAKLTCTCRRKAGPKMVQCRHCSELYHPGCLSLDPSETSSDRKIKCTFCKARDFLTLRDSKIPRPSLSNFIPLIDEYEWSFRYPVDEQDTIKAIIEAAARISKIALPLALSPPEPEHLDEELVVQYWIRKLQHVPFEIDIQRRNQDTVHLYPALINKLKLLRKKVKPATAEQQTMEVIVNVRFRNGWPTLIYRRWLPGDRKLRCLCVEKPKDAFLNLACSRCDQLFHASCVAAPVEALGSDGKPWTCPFCTINDGMEYQYAEVRSQLLEHFGTQIFVDGPETIQRGLSYVTRLEPLDRPPSDRPVIDLEILTFYADGPVVSGSIGRAFDRARNGEVSQAGTSVQRTASANVIPAGPEQEPQNVASDAMQWRQPPSESTSTGWIRRESAHTSSSGIAETAYSDRISKQHAQPEYGSERVVPYHRDRHMVDGQLSSRPPYPSTRMPTYSPRHATDAYQPSASGQSYYGAANPDLAVQDRPTSSPNHRIPLNSPRHDDDAVYRRLENRERPGWRGQQRDASSFRGYGASEDRGLPSSSSGGQQPASARLPREAYYPRRQHQEQTDGASSDYPPYAAPVQAPPPIISDRNLVQPLPPSQFTSQMEIPPFRGGRFTSMTADGQEG